MAPICEDAPCCGCCGTNIYGVYQGDDVSMDSYYCDVCGYNHVGECMDDLLIDEDEDLVDDDEDEDGA